MLEDLVHQVESRLRDLGRRLWAADPVAAAASEAERVSARLAECQQTLRGLCGERAAAQRRVRVNRELLSRLPDLIRRCLDAGRAEESWRHALALDRARVELVRDEADLPRLGQVCWSLHFQARQLQRRLDGLRRRPVAS
jgi:hypothetical protein